MRWSSHSQSGGWVIEWWIVARKNNACNKTKLKMSVTHFYGWVSFPNVSLYMCVCVEDVWKVNARVIFSTSALHSFCMFFSFDDHSVLVLSIHTTDNNEVHSSATYTHTHTHSCRVYWIWCEKSRCGKCLFAFGFFLLMRIWLPGNKMTFFAP